MKTETKPCKYGIFSYFADDEFVGKSLKHYGQFSDPELDVFRKTVKQGDTVIDVGANIGALTIPMAQHVGPGGRVLAFEPQPETFDLLKRNIEQNGLEGVIYARRCAVGSELGTIAMPKLDELKGYNYGGVALGTGGSSVVVRTIDSFNLKNVTFIKVDVEGMEQEVLAGARDTIMRCRPFLYVENDRGDKSNALVSAIVDMGYRLYWHRPLLYSHDNWRGEKHNAFSAIVSINMICVPEELGANIDGCDEVADIRMDAQMYHRELARFSKIVARNESDIAAKKKGARPDFLARLQMAHYANLTRQYDLMRDILKGHEDDPAAQTLMGLVDLQHGKWNWTAYETRYKQKNTITFGGHRAPNLPQWKGEETDDVVLVWAEQGFGDSFMFGRFIAEALELAPNLIVEVQPQMFELFEVSGVVPPGQLFRQGRTLPEAKLHCSIPSLAWALNADGDMVARLGAAPYLHAEPNMAKIWKERGTPRVGVCCKGSPRSERPYSRDIDVMELKTLIDDFGPFMTLENLGQFESFADTAAAISALDIVLTVDTSIAHLAGAMGKTTWLMLSYDPDWRWGLHGSTTVWYPTMKIFRQPKLLDWKSVVRDVYAAFDKVWHKKAA